MALKDQLDFTCNIYKKEKVTTNWTTRNTQTDIYNNIICHFYKVKWVLKSTDLSQETPIITAKVIIEPDKINVRKGMFIDIIDKYVWNIWMYEIDFVKPNHTQKWLDSFEIQLKNI